MPYVIRKSENRFLYIKGFLHKRAMNLVYDYSYGCLPKTRGKSRNFETMFMLIKERQP